MLILYYPKYSLNIINKLFLKFINYFYLYYIYNNILHIFYYFKQNNNLSFFVHYVPSFLFCLYINRIFNNYDKLKI